VIRDDRLFGLSFPFFLCPSSPLRPVDRESVSLSAVLFTTPAIPPFKAFSPPMPFCSLWFFFFFDFETHSDHYRPSPIFLVTAEPDLKRETLSLFTCFFYLLLIGVMRAHVFPFQPRRASMPISRHVLWRMFPFLAVDL